MATPEEIMAQRGDGRASGPLRVNIGGGLRVTDDGRLDVQALNRDIQALIDAGADEADVDEYVVAHGLTVDELRATNESLTQQGIPLVSTVDVPSAAEAPPQDAAPEAAPSNYAYNATDKAASFLTMGLSDKAAALGDALGGEGGELLGTRAPASFNDRYNESLAARDAASAAYTEQNPIATGAMSPLMLMGAVPMRGAQAVGSLGMAAKQGSILGGMGGAGQSRGGLAEQFGETLAGSGVGALLGPLLQLGVNAGSNVLARTRAVPPDIANRAEVAAAAARQNIDLMPADVGGAVTRGLSAAARQSPFAAGAMERGGQRAVASAENAVDRAAFTMGKTLDNKALGERAQEGARKYIAESRRAGGTLYDRAETLSNGAQVTPLNALNAIDENLAELSATPGTNAQAIGILETLKTDLESAPLTVQSVRRLRTNIRDRFIGEGLRGSDLERRVSGILDAASDDIGTALATNQRAKAAYDAADKFWKQRVETIDDALAKILGKTDNLSGEQAASKLIALAGKSGDSEALAGILNALPKAARADVSASILANLGRATPGAQNATGDAFSVATFGTNWNNLTPAAKGALFPDRAHRAAINDIAKVIVDGMKAASKMNNSSNTGGAIISGATLSPLFTGDLLTTATLATGQYGMGRLLSSPAFARWLAPTIRQRNATAIGQRLSVLPRMASANPVIRQEVMGFYTAANDSLRAAAEGGDGKNKQPNAQKPEGDGGAEPRRKGEGG